jgi:hypothetical protein
MEKSLSFGLLKNENDHYTGGKLLKSSDFVAIEALCCQVAGQKVRILLQ